ncbi:hypothetical protein NDU88_004705 [Pleurodeles waltl]|uniref:Uncharacterized protein n=1 Tax=Pleurodeles waltl TaxID=8319 RepID=A0AAV7WYP0_PLEWA|nr:hypothetical protein NDU88_004705 [Pleurodeles waltl]
MGDGEPACRGHQPTTTRQHEQPGPLSPHLQVPTSSSSLAGSTISPRGPSRPIKSSAGTDVSQRLPPPRTDTAPITSLQQLFQYAPKRDPVLWGVPSPRHHRNQALSRCRRGPASSLEGPAGPAQIHHQPPGGTHRPLVRSVLLVPQGVSSPHRGAETTGGSRRKGTLAQGSGLSRARHATPHGHAASRPRPAGPTHAVASQLCCGLLQEDRSQPLQVSGLHGP